MKRSYRPEHEVFRESFRRWLDTEVVPHRAEWDEAGVMPRDVYVSAGSHGFLGMAVPEALGGGGVDDFRFHAVVAEEIAYADSGAGPFGITLHNDVCTPYLLAYATEEQRQRWLPGVASGESVLAIAMTEPGTGSDLAGVQTTAVRDSDCYVVNGAKTFISNGINADLVITVVRTTPGRGHDGLSLLVLERGAEGFLRGRNLDKLGLHAQDTAELSFQDVRVPASNLLGEEGRGFGYLMENLAQERLSVAVSSVAAARKAFEDVVRYVKDRKAFGSALSTFQNTRFRLAEVATELELAESFLDRCLDALGQNTLTGVEAAMAKWWCTEMQGRVVDSCLQLYGGYGYMREYPISRAYADARVSRIYGGTTEIMKEIVGRAVLS